MLIVPLTGKAAGQWSVVVTNPDGHSGTLANGFAVTTPGQGNTPFIIDIASMNTFDGFDNSYSKITKDRIQQYPVETHIKNKIDLKIGAHISFL